MATSNTVKAAPVQSPRNPVLEQWCAQRDILSIEKSSSNVFMTSFLLTKFKLFIQKNSHVFQCFQHILSAACTLLLLCASIFLPKAEGAGESLPTEEMRKPWHTGSAPSARSHFQCTDIPVLCSGSFA